MYVKNIQIIKDYFLNAGITPKALETLIPKRIETEVVSMEEIFEYIMEPERMENVKTIDSDPEFARWSDGKELFM
ncbi:hypothetical protein DES36_10591 [Alkalibaculum bacchi]|uniref:Uncharacterized protein n=1 Tax=Alkalibaculum bacchi TaxID=645887 RepID=A0A366IB98_9FIRM|nr:hypothetical protein [Alkalibaculum bacchi]RBP66710.1 hypothetical protein DES36_10591 [Alkalibaculum bacchi]